MNQHIATDTLTDYVRGELPSAEDALVHAHLASCTQCRAEYDVEIAIGETLRRLAAAEEVEMPSMVSARVWEQIRAARPSPFTWVGAFFRPVVAVPLAAALAVGAFFASPLGHPATSAPTIDAMYYLQAHAAQTRRSPFSSNVSPIETSMAAGRASDATHPSIVARYEAYAAVGEFDGAVR